MLASPSTRRLVLLQALIATLTLVGYLHFTGGLTSRITLAGEDVGIPASDGDVQLDFGVDVIVYHLLGESPLTPFASEYTLKLCLRSIIKQVPWRTGKIFIVTDAAEAVKQQINVEMARLMSIELIDVGILPKGKDETVVESSLRSLVQSYTVSGSVFVIPSTFVFLQRQPLISYSDRSYTGVRGGAENWVLAEPSVADIVALLSESHLSSLPLMFHVPTLRSMLNTGTQLHLSQLSSQCRRLSTCVPGPAEPPTVETVILLPNEFDTYVALTRRLILNRPSIVNIVTDPATETAYKREVARETATDAKEVKAAIEYYVKQRKSQQDVKRPGNRRDSIRETHMLPYILQKVLILPVSDENTRQIASQYEVNPPRFNRNVEWMAKFDRGIAEAGTQ